MVTTFAVAAVSSSPSACMQLLGWPSIDGRHRNGRHYIQPASLSRGRLGSGRRQLPGLHFRLKSDLLVAAVAEGLVLRMTAPAETDCRAPREIERLAFSVVDCELALDAQRAVVLYRNLGFCQLNLLGIRSRQGGPPRYGFHLTGCSKALIVMLIPLCGRSISVA